MGSLILHSAAQDGQQCFVVFAKHDMRYHVVVFMKTCMGARTSQQARDALNPVHEAQGCGDWCLNGACRCAIGLALSLAGGAVLGAA